MTEVPEISLKAEQTGSLDNVALDDATSYQLLGVIRDGIRGGKHMAQPEDGKGVRQRTEEGQHEMPLPLQAQTVFCTLPIVSIELTGVRLSRDAADSLYSILQQQQRCLSRLVLNRFHPTPATDPRAIRAIIHLLSNPQSSLQTLEIGNEQSRSTDQQQRLVFKLTNAVIDNTTLQYFNGIPLKRNRASADPLEEIKQSSTSNVGKYSIGQLTNTPFKGVIVSITSNEPGATSGPGILDIRRCRGSRATVAPEEWRVQVAKTGAMGVSVFHALLKGYERGHGARESLNGQTLEGKREANVDSSHPILKVFFQWQLATVAPIMLEELNGLSLRNVNESGRLNLHGRVLEPYEQTFVANLISRTMQYKGQHQIVSVTFQPGLVVFVDAFRSNQGRETAVSTPLYEFDAGQDSDTLEKIKQSTTSNVAKYHIGQHVDTPFRGVVVRIMPKSVGAKSGPGVIDIDIKTQAIREEGDVQKSRTSNISKGIEIGITPNEAGATSGPGRLAFRTQDRLDKDAVAKATQGPTSKCSTSNIAKYRIGQHTETPFRGVVVGITPNTDGAKSGPGVLELRTDREDVLWSGPSVHDIDCCLISKLVSVGWLRSLDFSCNAITDQGAFSLAACLKTNASLRTLILNKNDIRDSGLSELASALELNRTLTRFDVSGNKVPNVHKTRRSKPIRYISYRPLHTDVLAWSASPRYCATS
jgi:heat shock protein HspQ